MLQKLRTNIEAGSYYEAHEMFKTVYHRYRSRKQLEDSYRLAEVRVCILDRCPMPGVLSLPVRH